jgi:hypothetical protein
LPVVSGCTGTRCLEKIQNKDDFHFIGFNRSVA